MFFYRLWMHVTRCVFIPVRQWAAPSVHVAKVVGVTSSEVFKCLVCLQYMCTYWKRWSSGHSAKGMGAKIQKKRVTSNNRISYGFMSKYACVCRFALY